MKTDTLFYRLFQDRPALVFELAGMPVPADADYVLRAEEIKETAFRLDGLLVPTVTGAHPLVFLEVQFQPDATFYARWFAEIYLYLYRRKVHGEWRAVVLYPGRGAETGAEAAHRTTLANPWVHRVYLDEADPTAGASPGFALVGLILAKPEASATRARELVHNGGSERDWILDWVETILVYKFPKLSREDIRMMLDLKDPDLKKSRFYQEVYAEGYEEGLEEGRQEGRQESREEGRHGEALALILRLLRRRLGTLPAGAEERIVALSVPRIEALGEALLDFARPADLLGWLDRTVP